MIFSIFKEFFLLGLYSFGGPAAHIGYFRQHFVQRLQWLSSEQFAQYVAMSQVIPGPGSSQLGFAIGHQRGGNMGAIAAFVGFTLPSFVFMVLLAIGAANFLDNPMMIKLILGLKLLAFVVIIDAILAMFAQFCRTKFTQSLAILTAASIWLCQDVSAINGAFLQLAILIIAAIVGGIWLSNSHANSNKPWTWRSLIIWPLVFAFIAMVAIIVQTSQLFPDLAFMTDYLQAGSSVFGGGHVVLPLLHEQLSEVTNEQFLTAYAAAQAMPGPMFTLASYLGATQLPQQPWLGAAFATIAIFTPGLMLMLMFKNGWSVISNWRYMSGAIIAINASVVGLLIAVAYQPVFTSAVQQPLHLAAVALGLVLVRIAKIHIAMLVLGFMLLGQFL